MRAHHIRIVGVVGSNPIRSIVTSGSFIEIAALFSWLRALYNGPPVKTTISNFIVNQIFPILTLAASRATPHI